MKTKYCAWMALGTACVMAGLLVASPALAQDKKVELKLELPKPMFVGTPKNIVSDNLEPITGKPRPTIMVPDGCTTNLAAEKPVTASDSEPIIGELEMVTDGDKEGSDGSFVEFGPGVQWVQVDLEQTCEICGILVWHYHSQARVYKDFIVQVSNDPDFVKDVVTICNNDHDNSAGLGVGKEKEYIEVFEGRWVDAAKDGNPVKGRYVRCYSNGNTSNDMNHMIEIEVFGRPAK